MLEKDANKGKRTRHLQRTDYNRWHLERVAQLAHRDRVRAVGVEHVEHFLRRVLLLAREVDRADVESPGRAPGRRRRRRAARAALGLVRRGRLLLGALGLGRVELARLERVLGGRELELGRLQGAYDSYFSVVKTPNPRATRHL